MSLKYCIKILQNQIRNFSTRKNHYNSLGVSSKATQADIKTAYYKLSMVYHPDKLNTDDEKKYNNNNSENAQKFRDITEAYEILGNVRSRKLYDRGLYFKSAVADVETPEPETPTHKFYKSRDVRSKPPAPQGRTVVYNFDEWSRTHYASTFVKDKRTKERRIREIYINEEIRDIARKERMILMIIFIIMFALTVYKSQDYDQTTYVSKTTTTRESVDGNNNNKTTQVSNVQTINSRSKND